MIHVTRLPEPRMSRELQNEKNRLLEYMLHSQELFRNEGMRFSRRFYDKPVRQLDPQWFDALIKQFNGKCAYCESEVGQHGEIDYFRPVDGVIGNQKELSDSHYIWLAYEWSNMYLVCQTCARMKMNQFPVEGNRARPFADVIRERPLLIDPCVDYPERHLYFHDDGMVYGKTRRGRITISILNLNRQELVKMRRERIEILNTMLKGTETDFAIYATLEYVNQSSPYLAPVKHCFGRWFQNLDLNVRRNLTQTFGVGQLITRLFGGFTTQQDLMDKVSEFTEAV